MSTFTRDLSALTRAFKRKKGSDQLSGGSLAAGNRSLVSGGGSECCDGGDEENSNSTGVFNMPIARNDEAGGNCFSPRDLNTNSNTSDVSYPNNTTKQDVTTTDTNGQARRTNSAGNPDSSHSARRGGKLKAGSQVVAGNRTAHIARVLDAKAVAIISTSVQEIQSLEEASSDGSSNNGNNHLADTEEEEEEEEDAIAASDLQYEALRRQHTALNREKQSLERKYNAVDAKHEVFKNECIRLTGENSKLEKDNQRLQCEIQPLKEEVGRLSAECSILLTSIPVLETDRDTWKAQHATLNDTYRTERSMVTALNTALETRRRELEQCESSNATLLEGKRVLEEKINELESRLKNVNGQLKISQEESKKLLKRTKQLSAQLAGYQFEGSIYADDSYFRQEWNNLDAKIANWSHHNFGESSQAFSGAAGLFKRPQKLHEKHVLQRVATDPNRYLTSAERRPSFVQSFVWSFLVEKIFTPPGSGGSSDLCGLYWSGSVRGELDFISIFLCPDLALKKDRKVPEIEMRKYMKWKAATTQLILEKINKDSDKEALVYEELLAGLCNIILACLEPFITSNDMDSRCRSLQNILRFAIRLDGKLNQQLARIAPQYTWTRSRTNCFHEFQFDPRIMSLPQEEPNLGLAAKVQMVLRPALVRHGSIEGEKYESFQKPDVLLPAVVHLQSSSGFRAKLTKLPADNWDHNQPRNGKYTSSKK